MIKNKTGNQLIRSTLRTFLFKDLHVTNITVKEYKKNENEVPKATLLIFLPSIITKPIVNPRANKHIAQVLINNLRFNFSTERTFENNIDVEYKATPTISI